MLSNACFEVFHTDTGNTLRNQSYNGILKSVSFLPRLGSPTMYLNTLDKVENFINLHPDFKVNTVEDSRVVLNGSVLLITRFQPLKFYRTYRTTGKRSEPKRSEAEKQ